MNDSEQTEGEHLATLGRFESFPFRLLIAFASAFPVNGDSFWLVVAPKRLPGRGAGTALAVTEGLRQTERCELLYNPSGSLRSPQRWLEYGRLAALPLAILPIPPDSPLAASPTWRARLESPARGDSFWLALPKGFFSHFPLILRWRCGEK